MNKNNNGKAQGLTFSGALLIAFIVLKLCNVINWPWIWVLSPLWIPFVLVLIILIGITIWTGR